MIQTCQTLDNLRPLWANQGLQYHKKMSLWDLLVEQRNPAKEIASSMQEREARTLSQLYTPWNEDEESTHTYNITEGDLKNGEVQELLKTLQSTAKHLVLDA